MNNLARAVLVASMTLVTAGVAVPRAGAVPDSYTVVPLTDPSVCMRFASAINESGDVTGIAQFLNSGNPPSASSVYGFRWHDGTFSRLQDADPNGGPGNGSQGCAAGPHELTHDISDNGAIVGQGLFPDPNRTNATNNAALWPAGGGAPRSLGLLPDFNGGCRGFGWSSQAEAINAAGDVTGESTACVSGSGGFDPFFLPAGGKLDMNGVDIKHNTSGISEGFAINSADQVVILNKDSHNAVLPSTLWSRNGNTTKTLPFVPPFMPSILNDAGVVVGADNGLPVYSVNAGPETLLPLPGDYTHGHAYGVDSAGDVVGDAFEPSSGFHEAVLWPAAVPPATGLAPAPVVLQGLVGGAQVQLDSGLDITTSGYILAKNPSGWDVLVPGAQRISGKVTDPQDGPVAGVPIDITGSDGSVQTVTTGGGGSYVAAPQPGTYTVTPRGSGPQARSEFTPGACDGSTATRPASCRIQLSSGANAHADFVGAFKLRGQVLGPDGQGLAGASVALELQGARPEATSAVTDGTGAFAIDLGPGSWLATATKDKAPLFPVPSADCRISQSGCLVDLNEDRLIGFGSCVLPDSRGGPLPANTPDPIPGAVTKAPLEAVGCWQAQNGDASTAPTIFTSTQSVRLDGIDVNPSPGTTLTLDTSGPTVQSDGPAQMLIGGFAITRAVPLTLSYRNGVNPAGGGGVSVNDPGSATAPAAIAPSIFGLPISLGTANPLGYGLPWVESTGQTVINAGLQVPVNTRGAWDFAQGKFVDAGGKDVPSIGASSTITATDRTGVSGQACISVNDWHPFEGKFGTIAGAQGCWNPSQQQITGAGQFLLPTALARLAGDINLTFALQNAASSATAKLQGYQVQSFEIQFDHLDTKTYQDPGVPDVRESGIPIGDGFFLQSLGGGFKNNLALGTVSSVNGTAGISFGPEFDIASNQVQLVRFDGKVEVQPPQTAGDPWVYQLAGAASLGRLTAYEMHLANVAVTYIASATNPQADLDAHAGAMLPVVGGVSVDLKGQSDVPHGLVAEGTATEKLFGRVGTIDLLLDNTILADCFTAGSFTSGFDFDFRTGHPRVGCNMSGLHHPQSTPQSLGQTSSAGRPVRFGLRRGLAGTMIAVRGRGGAPRFTLSGPGLRLTTKAGTKRQDGRRAIVFTDASANTTYVSLLRPGAGKWTLIPRAGSAPVASLLEADPLPLAQITGRVARAGCGARLTYRLRPRPGLHVLLYAQQGRRRTFVGQARGRGGRFAVPLVAQAKGRGHIVAIFVRGRRPVAVRTIASFRDARSAGGEAPTGLSLRGTTVRWHAACFARAYRVAITRGVQTTQLETTARHAPVPAGTGATKVTVTALDAQRAPLGSARRTFR